MLLMVRSEQIPVPESNEALRKKAIAKKNRYGSHKLSN
jgi:hypothetical protein